MTNSPAIYGEFGQALGLAERTLSAILRQHLAERDVEPETWYALKLIATRGPKYPRTAVSETLESPSFDRDAARTLLTRLEAQRLISGDEALDLTPDGDALYRSLREHVAGRSTQLLSQFDIHDLETTVRTLQGITARAMEGEAN
jgi:hypothetical protein